MVWEGTGKLVSRWNIYWAKSAGNAVFKNKGAQIDT